MMKTFWALGYDIFCDYLLTSDPLLILKFITRPSGWIWINCCLFCVFVNRKNIVRRVRRLNPLVNARAMLRLNPYAAVLKRQAILANEKRKNERDIVLAKRRGVSCCFLLYWYVFLRRETFKLFHIRQRIIAKLSL